MDIIIFRSHCMTEYFTNLIMILIEYFIFARRTRASSETLSETEKQARLGGNKVLIQG